MNVWRPCRWMNVLRACCCHWKLLHHIISSNQRWERIGDLWLLLHSLACFPMNKTSRRNTNWNCLFNICCRPCRRLLLELLNVVSNLPEALSDGFFNWWRDILLAFCIFIYIKHINDKEMWTNSCEVSQRARPVEASDRQIWFLPGTSPRAPEKSVTISSSRSEGPCRCLDWPWVDSQVGFVCRDPFGAFGVFDTFTNGMKNFCGNTWTLWEFDWIAFSLCLFLCRYNNTIHLGSPAAWGSDSKHFCRDMHFRSCVWRESSDKVHYQVVV